MSPFGTAAGPDLRFAWLAGLLEAEGTFIRPTPSEPRLPIVALQMTDRDIVERVAAMFGTTVTSTPREPRQTIYSTRIKGSRAVLLMDDLLPAMGKRRREAMNSAVDAYQAPLRKLDYGTAEAIRDLHVRGASISSLARTFNVARPTIRQVLERSIYSLPACTPWCRSNLADAPVELDGEISPIELHWLAGWLEGEGSFSRPPPSDPRRVRIAGTTRDSDVASEIGRLMRVKPVFSHAARERQLGWSATWRLLKRGHGAANLMRAVRPLMGSRRQVQIEAALATSD